MGKRKINRIRRTYRKEKPLQPDTEIPFHLDNFPERMMVEDLGIPLDFITDNEKDLGAPEVHDGEIYYRGHNVRLVFIKWRYKTMKSSEAEADVYKEDIWF